jgi:hypothetical protein
MISIMILIQYHMDLEKKNNNLLFNLIYLVELNNLLLSFHDHIL